MFRHTPTWRHGVGWQDVVNCGCNKSQVFKMGNLEKQGLEVVPLELLRAKERLRFKR